MTEFWWAACLSKVLKRGRKQSRTDESASKTKTNRPRGLVVTGEVVLSEEVAAVLNKGTKYSHETSVSAHDLLALSRSILQKTDSERKERCLLERVEALKKTVDTKVTKPAKYPTRNVV
ncbi:hypothetical protein HPB50_021135 [Hyalomma asiaticum]|uniref:Uncharacterized protein n=1 Tax=Hyalomma asiaticum TaxID=266040 RepID=A0ACB7TNN4_HYAAI|nr:hypothetical protein HPB50_021135 [Hyalomma asiaticum]